MLTSSGIISENVLCYTAAAILVTNKISKILKQTQLVVIEVNSSRQREADEEIKKLCRTTIR